LIVLTDDEQQNALELFATERPQIHERVRPLVEALDPVDPSFEQRPPPVQRDRRQLARLAALLSVAATVGFMVGFHLLSGKSAGDIVASPGRSAERTKSSFESGKGAALPAIPVSGTIPLINEPTTTLDRAKRMGDAFATVPREARDEPETPRSAPPATAVLSTRLQEAPALRERPIAVGPSLSSARTVEPAALPEPPSAPPLGSFGLPTSVQVEPGPVAAVAAALPRADPIGPLVSRAPASDTGAIQTVLSRYRTAFRDLDAGAAQVVWPGVDAKALRRAFERLERQDLSFNSCQIAVKEILAVASCDGTATYVPRVGNRGRHDERLQWEFKLRKLDDAWVIDSVSAR
jgi:hypothetical protein